jgi:hypothetical protein
MSTVGGGSRYQLPESGGPEGDSGPDCIAYFFVFPGSTIICRQYKLPLSDKAPVHSETESQSFRFKLKICSRCVGGGGRVGSGRSFFLPGPEPTFGGRGCVCKTAATFYFPDVKTYQNY